MGVARPQVEIVRFPDNGYSTNMRDGLPLLPIRIHGNDALRTDACKCGVRSGNHVTLDKLTEFCVGADM